MHLYLHIPYCARKCPYCDFNSVAGRDGEMAAYVEALLLEVARLPRGPYATVFIGGGTPTSLPPRLMERFLAGVRAHITLTADYEWTCEANPGTSDAERFRLLADHGVNRLSLGIQSTHDHHLRFLGRVHTAAEGERAIALAVAAVPRVNADLIMGLPDQTPGEFAQDLELFRRFQLSHASVYHLAYETGTEFYARKQRGELTEIDAERSRLLFTDLTTRLADLGLAPYETSNFSRPGHECRHNLAYWTRRDYQAAGAGAVSTIAGLRLTREKHSGNYITAITNGGDAIWRREDLTVLEQQREAWMLGLRLSVGVAAADLIALGDDPARWTPRAAPLLAEGLLDDTGTHLRLTPAGRPVQDEVTVALMP